MCTHNLRTISTKIEQVNSQVSQGVAAAKGARVTGTPSLMVNGKYLISAGKAGDQASMLKVAEYLIEQERASAN